MLKMAGRAVRALSPINLSNPLVGKVTTDPTYPKVLRANSIFIYEGQVTEVPIGFGAVLYRTESYPALRDGVNHVLIGSEYDHLVSGDIVRITEELALRVMYRRNGTNFMLLTERCNSFCIMCSQPPRDIDDSHLVQEWLTAIPLMDDGRQIGITGGEPTLVGDGLFNILASIRSHLPTSPVHMLTNGRNFQDISLATRLATMKMGDLMLGIPLYSDVASVHDYIVQADGAFDETIRGILNLGRCGVPIEIRVVIHSGNIDRLLDLCQFIARNLQFVHQVALMALEPTGFAKANMDKLWIDPFDYQDVLVDAVEILRRSHIRTHLFNHQLCTLPHSLWPYAAQSISEWKNEYLDECRGCEVKSQCGGFFSSATNKHSDHILPIQL